MSVEFVVFSDLHLHEFAFQAQNTGSLGQMHGLNTRLVHCFEAAKAAVDYALANNIELVLFGGDFTHSRKPHLTKDVVNAFHFFFQSYLGSPVTIGMIPGNHDYIDKEGLNHLLLSVASYPHVVLMDWNARAEQDLFRFETSQGVLYVRAVPYTEDGELLKRVIQAPLPELPEDAFKILLSHAGMQGARVGSDYIMVKDYDLDVEDVPKRVFDACFFGHFHEHQVVFQNGWIIGSTHQMDWSDAGGLRGFCHVTIHDDHTVELKHIETNPKLPRFHVLKQDEEDCSKVRPHDFVKFKATEVMSEEAKERIEALVAKKVGALPTAFEIVPVPPEKKEVQLSERAISADLALEDWVAQCGKWFDQEKLLAFGKELLAEARRSLE